jgi:hypothetical protein
MHEWACLAIISIIGLTACAHPGANRSEQPSVPSVSPPSAPPAAASAPVPPTATATLPSVDGTPPVESQPTNPENPKPPSAARNSKPVTSVAKPSAPKAAQENLTPPSALVMPAPAPAGVRGSVPSPSPTPSTPKPQLDFKALEQRLRDTSAIGVFTKLSIKNQVDDLLKAFRGFYAGRTPPTLDDLHQRYDGLLLKVVTLIQDDDANLASSISASRSAIWERLSNRESFQQI